MNESDAVETHLVAQQNVRPTAAGIVSFLVTHLLGALTPPRARIMQSTRRLYTQNWGK